MHTSKEGPSIQASSSTELKQKRSRVSTPGVAILKEFAREHGLHPSPVQFQFLIERVHATDGNTDFDLRRLEDWFRRRRTADSTSTSKNRQDTPNLSIRTEQPRYLTLTATSIKRLETLSRTQPNPPAEVLLTWSELLFASVQDVTAWLDERNRAQITPVESPIPSPNPTGLQLYRATPLETSLRGQMPISTPVSVPLPPHYQSSVQPQLKSSAPPLPSRSVSQSVLSSAVPKPIYSTNSASPSLSHTMQSPGKIMSLSASDGSALPPPGSANLPLPTRFYFSAPSASPSIPASMPSTNTSTPTTLPVSGAPGSTEKVLPPGQNLPSVAVAPPILAQPQLESPKLQAALHQSTLAESSNDNLTKISTPDSVKVAILNGIREGLCNVPLPSTVPTNLNEFNAWFAPFSEDMRKLEKLLK